MKLSDLTGKHQGADIYVIGSGATLTYVDKRFFGDKIVVATNLAAHGLGLQAAVTYVHSHYHENVAFQYNEHPDWTFVTPLGDRGFSGQPEVRLDRVVYYEHVPTSGDFTVEKARHPNGLIVGSSSIHGSMHLAALMGARTVILVGADCGLLDGRSNYEGYCDERGNVQSGDLIANDALAWMDRWNGHLGEVASWLRNEFECSVHSLNPFVNPNMEGHTFSSFAGRIN